MDTVSNIKYKSRFCHEHAIEALELWIHLHVSTHPVLTWFLGAVSHGLPCRPTGPLSAYTNKIITPTAGSSTNNLLPYSGKFLRAQIFANHQQTRQEKNFAIFIFATRSRYLTTPPTISHMEMVTLSVYFNVKTTVRR